jgi:hypothetical protein
MRIVLGVVVSVLVLGLAVAAWCVRRLWIYTRTEQYVVLTEKRYAELLDVERRQ